MTATRNLARRAGVAGVALGLAIGVTATPAQAMKPVKETRRLHRLRRDPQGAQGRHPTRRQPCREAGPAQARGSQGGKSGQADRRPGTTRGGDPHRARPHLLGHRAGALPRDHQGPTATAAATCPTHASRPRSTRSTSATPAPASSSSSWRTPRPSRRQWWNLVGAYGSEHEHHPRRRQGGRHEVAPGRRGPGRARRLLGIAGPVPARLRLPSRPTSARRPRWTPGRCRASSTA